MEDRFAILDHVDVLQGERNFYAQTIRRRPAAEQYLRAAPAICARGKVKRKHFVGGRHPVTIRAGIEQRAHVIGLTDSGREHEHVYTFIALDVAAEMFPRQRLEEILVAFRRQSGVGIGAANEQRGEQRCVIFGQRPGQKRNRLAFRSRRHGVFL